MKSKISINDGVNLGVGLGLGFLAFKTCVIFSSCIVLLILDRKIDVCKIASRNDLVIYKELECEAKFKQEIKDEK